MPDQHPTTTDRHARFGGWPGRIDVGRPHHVLSATAYQQVRLRDGHAEIDDAVAVTIASWWQSGAGTGAAFAALSTTGRVEYADLADAIVDVFRHADARDRQALSALGTWALNHPSRHSSLLTDTQERP